jgi:alkanesulfonate monooxygenase SsuD/methylene tetrahydromethanopterin reductase-like flavin-dependent oxidoreductase (luciferase family)
MNIARSPQGHPVIIQAGGSPSGLELAARTADVVFSVVQELDSAKKAYADLKGRMAKYGRSPEQLSVLPGVMPIIGASEAEAKEKLNRLQGWLTPTNALTLPMATTSGDTVPPNSELPTYGSVGVDLIAPRYEATWNVILPPSFISVTWSREKFFCAARVLRWRSPYKGHDRTPVRHF